MIELFKLTIEKNIFCTYLFQYERFIFRLKGKNIWYNEEMMDIFVCYYIKNSKLNKSSCLWNQYSISRKDVLIVDLYSIKNCFDIV
jgi:hypothetical protein